jgi:HAD superfamily hydrolase (TIGR01549 family)
MKRAVTFDFWDTLVVDDSDELDRRALGLPPKSEARAAAVVAAVQSVADLPEASVRAAWEDALVTFRHQWKVEHRTPHIRERVAAVFGAFSLHDASSEQAALVEVLATMEVLHPPRLAPGVLDVLHELRGRVRVGIISDTIVTPGSGLRRILRDHNLAGFFDAMIFSDEVGCSKPSPKIFLEAASQLGVTPEALIHVGDRGVNDVDGPRSVGATGWLYAGVVDRHPEGWGGAPKLLHHDLIPAMLDGLGVP